MTATCAFEKAFNAGESTFKKPLSCHLYPIRLRKLKKITAIDYHQWDICCHALIKGEAEQVSVYQFLKEPLERAFGAEWYKELCIADDYLKKQHAK